MKKERDRCTSTICGTKVNSNTMASMTTSLAVPEGFPGVLRDYTRELLRAQPENIYEWSANYFSINSGSDSATTGGASGGDQSLQLDLVALKARIEDMFAAADQGNKGYLSRKEAHDLIQTLSPEFKVRFTCSAFCDVPK